VFVLRQIAIGVIALLSLFTGEQRVTIHMAGDSTMAIKRPDKRPETGWGEAFAGMVDSGCVRVMNHAMNGRSTRTFISEGRWQSLLDSTRAGDWVFIQFGHNDESPEKTDRYTPPDAYRANLIRFVADVRAKKAFPVLLTPVTRRKFDTAGAVVDTHAQYAQIVRDVAREDHVPLLDMHRASMAMLSRVGRQYSEPLFLHLKPGENANYPEGLKDDTHFSPLGADVMASIAVDLMRTTQLPLTRYLASGGSHCSK
jgi:lysophospholipase L1-like esterase